MIRTALLVSFVALAWVASLHAETPRSEPLYHVDEGKIYCIVNNENIEGRDILEMLVEDVWDEYLQNFVDFAIRREEVEKAKITVNEAEVDDELKLVLKNKVARDRHGRGGDRRTYTALVFWRRSNATRAWISA